MNTTATNLNRWGKPKFFYGRAPVAEPAYGYTEKEAMEAAWNGPLGHATHKVDWQIVAKPGSNQIGLLPKRGTVSWATKAMTDRIVYIKRRFIESLYRGKNARI